LFSLTYATEAQAKEAHDLMAKVIVGATITPHRRLWKSPVPVDAADNPT